MNWASSSRVVRWLRLIRQEDRAFFPGCLACGVVGIGIADVVLLCVQKGLQHGGVRRGVGRVIQINHGLPPMAVRSFTTSPAIISPTTEGTKALLPGT